MAMLDPQTAALLRAVLDEVCEALSQPNATRGMEVASKLLQGTLEQRAAIDCMSEAEQKTLRAPPTLWP
jgi:hypothetical protein